MSEHSWYPVGASCRERTAFNGRSWETGAAFFIAKDAAASLQINCFLANLNEE